MKPMINSLSLLYDLLGDNLGLAIISFTVLIRFVLIPLTVRQTKQMKKMQELQPQLQAIQKKHKNKTPQTKQKVQQETMALYKQAGVNPVGCLGPLIIQMPIWIGLYRAILKSAPSSPEGFVDLSKYFYSWNFSISKVPFNSNFLGIDLVDFVQFAPIMFGIFTWQFPAGLAVYIFFSNLMGIIIQYFVGGKQPLMLFGKLYFGTDQSREEYLEKLNNQKLSKETQIEETNNNKEDSNESKDIQRENSRRGNRRSLKNSKKRPRKPRN
jgi:YidC/Oxa1 family membrane protein insertase